MGRVLLMRTKILYMFSFGVSPFSILRGSCQAPTMAADCGSSSGTGVVDKDLFGAECGWVEARTTCDHLPSLCSDLSQIPLPDTPCFRCDHPAENWLCLICKDVFCSRFINKHMLKHHEETGHCLALSFSDLSVWCFNCDAYLDVQKIRKLQPVYEVAHLIKFGERPSFPSTESLELSTDKNEGST